jgi:hypothetical protein
MTAEEFEQILLRFKYHKPFQPFIVEMLDGRTIEITRPALTFDENGATYIAPGFEFVDFGRDKVRAMHLAQLTPIPDTQPRETVADQEHRVVQSREKCERRASGMTQKQFEETLLQFIRHKPFEPFVVEMLDGRVIEIPNPRVIVGGGAATFISPDFDMTDFYCDEVRGIRAAVPEAKA